MVKQIRNARIDSYGKEIVKSIQRLGCRHGTWQVFEDFLLLSAASISNAIDKVHHEKREQMYTDAIKKYTAKELAEFPKMFANLVEQMELHAESPADVLGPIFHELELHNKYKGQFFSPQSICDMMGMIAAGDSIPKKGYFTVCEPCTGSGAMVLGFANAMKKSGCSHSQMVVTATDIDLKCVFMTYIQLSLYGIPAVVIHGNSLTMEEWSRWYTPVYLLEGWIWREHCGNTTLQGAQDDEAVKATLDPMYDALRKVQALMTEVIENPGADEEPQEPRFNVNLQETRDGQFAQAGLTTKSSSRSEPKPKTPELSTLLLAKNKAGQLSLF